MSPHQHSRGTETRILSISLPATAYVYAQPSTAFSTVNKVVLNGSARIASSKNGYRNIEFLALPYSFDAETFKELTAVVSVVTDDNELPHKTQL
jgi:hypothetical protein